jgi:hypothetical protein
MRQCITGAGQYKGINMQRKIQLCVSKPIFGSINKVLENCPHVNDSFKDTFRAHADVALLATSGCVEDEDGWYSIEIDHTSAQIIVRGIIMLGFFYHKIFPKQFDTLTHDTLAAINYEYGMQQMKIMRDMALAHHKVGGDLDHNQMMIMLTTEVDPYAKN